MVTAIKSGDGPCSKEPVLMASRRYRGAIKMIKNSAKAAVVRNTYSASNPPEEFNKATTRASSTLYIYMSVKKQQVCLLYGTYQATQSFNRPADMVMTPTRVRSNLSSAKIRASTGNAYRCIKCHLAQFDSTDRARLYLQ